MNALYSGSIWPLAVLVWPLLLGLVPVVPRWRPHAFRLLPLAPLPALAFAMAGAPGITLVPDLLLGTALAAVPQGALLLGMTAVVWIVAGWHTAVTFKPGPESGIFAGFWCLTLAGNLGVFLAADIATFYVAFAAVSLAAWFLVVHDRTDKALAAGRLYILLAIVGEAALLAGLIIGVTATSGDLQITSVRDALPDAPLGQLAIALLVTGFGIKAGMVPLHIWLPIAHPAAPVPGSAVLSGTIVKAGLIGMMLFLPQGTEWGQLLLILGMIGAFGAAILGLTQRNPKAVLGYSTVSQMGLMLALLGAGSNAVAYYAVHHGLAKAALFLSCGVMAMAMGRLQRRVTLAVAGLAALSIAGVPMLGGALVKLAAKTGLEDALALILALTSVTTTLVLAWFLYLLSQTEAKSARGWPWLLAGVLLLTLLAMFLPWQMLTGKAGIVISPASLSAIGDALWPVAVGLAAFALVRSFPLPERPPPDILDVVDGYAARLRDFTLPRPGAVPAIRHAALRLLLRTTRVEAGLKAWPAAGLLLICAVVFFSWLLGPYT